MPGPREGIGGLGCGHEVEPGTTLERLRTSDGGRRFRLTVPEGYRADSATPLILDFHGFGGRPWSQSRYSGVAREGAARGYLVVTPRGSGRRPHWTYPGTRGVDDLHFVEVLLDSLHGRLCLDLERVYAAGISNGARFAMGLACHLSLPLAAVAPVAGVNAAPSCTSAARASVIAFHGTADPLVPYSGGRSGSSRDLAPVERAVAEWAVRDGCAGEPSTTSIGDDVRRLSWTGCTDGAAVELYAVDGGGHTWPGARPLPRLGETTETIDATALMLDFFDTHRALLSSSGP